MLPKPVSCTMFLYLIVGNLKNALGGRLHIIAQDPTMLPKPVSLCMHHVFISNCRKFKKCTGGRLYIIAQDPTMLPKPVSCTMFLYLIVGNLKNALGGRL